jgi:hypothetical protein
MRHVVVALNIEASMGRKLTFPDLKVQKGWPYSRQHTHTLVKAGRFPHPDKLYQGGLVNVWDEDVIDAHFASKTERDAGGEAA